MGERNVDLDWQYRYQNGLSNETLFQFQAEVDYHTRWRAYAFRRYVALILLLGWVPITLALFTLSRTSLHQPVLCLAMIAAWLGAAGGAVWWAGEFRCPSCRRRFGALGQRKTAGNITRGLFDKICGNCKLRKFEQAC